MKRNGFITLLTVFCLVACGETEGPRTEEPVVREPLPDFEVVRFEDMEDLIWHPNAMERFLAAGYVVTENSQIGNGHTKVVLEQHSDSETRIIELFRGAACSVHHFVDPTRFDVRNTLYNATMRTIGNEREFSKERNLVSYEAYIPGDDAVFEYDRAAMILDSVYTEQGCIRHFHEYCGYGGYRGTGITLHSLPDPSEVYNEEHPNLPNITYDSIAYLGYNLSVANK